MIYPLNFRKKILRIKHEERLTFAETSRRFGVNIRSLFRWQERIEPKLKRNKPATKIDMDALIELVKNEPDLYQYEMAKRLNVSKSCVGSALKRIHLSRKKTLINAKADENEKKLFQKKIEVHK